MSHKLRIMFIGVFTLVLSVNFMGVHTAKADTASDFISKLSPVVKTVAKKYNLYPSLMLAQAALESSYGQSSLATNDYNYFGIKGSYNGQSDTLKTAEYDSSGNIYYVNSSFRKYPNAQSSLEDYANLIRNGLVGASNFYSGTWKENAKSVNDAATALVGKYATDPNYANKLISIINKYNLTSLDSGITEQSNTVANGDTNTTTSGTTTVSTTTNNTTTAASDNVKVSYYDGDGNEQVPLSSGFKKQVLYDQISGTASNVKSYNWKSSLKAGSLVYADRVGYVKGNSGNQTWYRIRFTNESNAKRYWVKSQSLKFPTVKYFKFAPTVTANLLSKRVAYDHVYGSNTLSSKITDPDIASRVKYTANMIGISGSKNNAQVWIRYKLSSGKNAWIQIKRVSGIQTLPVSVSKRLSAQYGKYALYNGIPGTSGVQEQSWNTVSESSISTVNVDSIAVDANTKTIWAEIKIGNQKYWINNNALY
ncbi:glycoside hydrolase family 73 protein [Lactobacillus sp. Sy-1]|uniref:glycoside hydrolase family 73 protein n=1 Tax=Lactobacillus sp. Sy-1 TaxID=2109645 RepID=UPI001C5A6156|nr:glycoside hydrolase family 73 protein [Lactobacillus sp. Sy-1]MBW1605927.1 glycoside hydrolase family 73 protein [Lactobacillus sp. Sy-1]